VPSFAAEEISDLVSEEAVFEEVLEEIPEDVIEEDQAEEPEEDYQEPEEESAVEAEEEAEEEAFEAQEEVEEVPVEEEAELEEESLTEDDKDPVEEIVDDAETESTWKETEYKFVYHNKVGAKDYKESKTYTVADKDQELSASFTKAGYKLTGWQYKYSKALLPATTTVDEVVALADSNNDSKVDLYANWDEIRYSIVFCNAEGKELDVQPEGYTDLKYTAQVDLTSAAKQITEGLDEGVAVVGFYKGTETKTEYALGKKYSKLMDTEGQLLLYPVLGQGAYSVILEYDDATLSKELVSYMPGKRVALPTAKKTGYKFLGWVPDDGSNLEAFEMKKVKDADKNELQVAKAISKKAQAPIHLTAAFEPIRYKIYLDPNAKGVTFDGKPLKKKQFLGVFDYKEGQKVKAGNFDPEGEPEKKGSVFCGFALTSKPKSEDDFVSPENLEELTTKKSATLYCIWEQIDYVLDYENYATVFTGKAAGSDDAISKGVKIDAKKDDIYKEQMMNYGKQYKTPNVSIPGCTFIGWVIDSESEEDLVDVKTKEYKNSKGEKVFTFVTQVGKNNQSDLLLRAVFIEKYYTLTFDTNGGVFKKDGTSKTGEVKLIDGYTYPNPREEDVSVEDAIKEFKAGLSRDGYTLKGLYLDPKGKKKLPADLRELPKKTDDKVKIYAVWQKNK
jgi:hypothetical protein